MRVIKVRVWIGVTQQGDWITGLVFIPDWAILGSGARPFFIPGVGMGPQLKGNS